MEVDLKEPTKKYQQRFNSLNDKQKLAVKTTEGPVAVIAGPGTGKTELLGMRIANILRTTDTAPENILCLTYTDSGVLAMRQRLLEIIGSTAHKINIFTFHSFGSNIMNQNMSIFFDDVPFRAANSLMTHQIIKDIFTKLPHGHILASKNNGEFIKINRVKGAISNIKKGGLTSEELQVIISNNDIDIDKAENILSTVVGETVSKKSIDTYSRAALLLKDIERTNLPNDTPNLIDVIQNSLLRAINEANELEKSTPLSVWKRTWFEKDSTGRQVLKTRKKQIELKAIKQVYEQYVDAMNHAGLYDYDDMILMTLASLKNNKELLFNLQERYQYILIDEFQDTNQAQMQIIYQLIHNEINNDLPNIFIVGDDDQAIYGFQGADSSNITTFLNKYPKTKRIVLKDNYRSTQEILDQARKIITKGEDRLENTYSDLNKQLTSHTKSSKTHATINVYENANSERQAIVNSVEKLIKEGVEPNEIAVLARRHSELLEILPFFSKQNIPVAYEKSDNALDLESIIMLEKMAILFALLNQQKLEEAQALLPEILSHKSWGLSAETIWEISVRSYRNRTFWLETLKTIPETENIYQWFIETAANIFNLPIEQALDTLIGNSTPNEEGPGESYVSPFYNYFFSSKVLKENPANYLLHLNALSAVRTKLREYLNEEENPTLKNFTDFLELNRSTGEVISIAQNISTIKDKSVNLMTAHKSKGLEFDHVFIFNAVDDKWGSAVRNNNSSFKFPENIYLNPVGDNLDERIRLFYVAATRAKNTLTISHSNLNDKNKTTLRTSFLEEHEWSVNQKEPSNNLEELANQLQTSWSARITAPNQYLKDLLSSTLNNYKLTATSLNNFIDVTSGGPQNFLMQNLLHFPQSQSANAAYGSAIHKALQLAHIYYSKNNRHKPTEDVIADFETDLKNKHLPKEDLPIYLDRGVKALNAFLPSEHAKFTTNQTPEFDFSSQQVLYDDSLLTGKLDIIEINKNDKTISITDYKTGKPSASWKGKSAYEKIKLHKYKQQLMFYYLLVENSRDYNTYKIKNCLLSFVEPDDDGNIHTLSAEFSDEEYNDFKKLIKSVYHHIVDLSLPDTSNYQEDINGILEFEKDLTNS